MIRAHADAEVTARTMIEIEPKVVLIVAAAVQDHAVFLLVHIREEPVRLAAVLRNVQRVAHEIAGIEEAIHLVVERARLERIVLKARVNGIRHAQLAGHHLPRRVQELALGIREERMLLCPVHLPTELVVSILGADGELGGAFSEARTTARTNLDHARGRARAVQRGGRGALHHFHTLDVHRLEIGAGGVE